MCVSIHIYIFCMPNKRHGRGPPTSLPDLVSGGAQSQVPCPAAPQMLHVIWSSSERASVSAYSTFYCPLAWFPIIFIRVILEANPRWWFVDSVWVWCWEASKGGKYKTEVGRRPEELSYWVRYHCEHLGRCGKTGIGVFLRGTELGYLSRNFHSPLIKGFHGTLGLPLSGQLGCSQERSR